MDKKDIHLYDIHRILFGEAPAIFLVEVLIRTLITYIVLLVVTRWLGKRMIGQLSITEMAVMLTLGAIVSVAMQVPECGIVMAILVLLCTLTFERGLSWLEFKSNKVENITQGKVSLLVADGVINQDAMKEARISHQQLFAQLRAEGIYNLGAIKRVYIEASGIFSIYKAQKEKPGLATFPPDDKAMLERQTQAPLMVCVNCGFLKEHDQQETCSDCGKNIWTSAITTAS